MNLLRIIFVFASLTLLTTCGDAESLFGGGESTPTPAVFDSLDEEVRGQFTKIINIDPGKEVTLEVTAFRFRSDVSMSLNNLIQVGFEPHTEGALQISDSLIEFTNGFTSVVKLLDKKRCGKFVLDILNILLCPGSMSFAGFAEGSAFGLRVAGGKTPGETDFYDLSFAIYKSKAEFDSLESAVTSLGAFEQTEQSEAKIEETEGGKSAKDSVSSGQSSTPKTTVPITPHAAITGLTSGMLTSLGITYGHNIDMAFLGKNSLISKNKFNVAVSAGPSVANEEDTLHLISIQEGIPVKTLSQIISSFGSVTDPSNFVATVLVTNDLGDKLVVHSETDTDSGDAFNFLALEIINGGTSLAVDPLMFTGGTTPAYAQSTFNYIANDDRAKVQDMIYTDAGITAFGYADRNDGNANKYKLMFSVDKDDTYRAVSTLPDVSSKFAILQSLVTYFSDNEPKKFENNTARVFLDGMGEGRNDFAISSCNFSTGSCVHKTILESSVSSQGADQNVWVFGMDATEIHGYPGTYNSLYLVEFSSNPRRHSVILAQTIISDFTNDETLSVQSKASYAFSDGDTVEKGIISPTGDYILVVVRHDNGTHDFQVIKVNR